MTARLERLSRKRCQCLPVKSLLGSTVCPASKAGRVAERWVQEKGLYLSRAVVQIYQDIQGLKHSTHGVDDD